MKITKVSMGPLGSDSPSVTLIDEEVTLPEGILLANGVTAYINPYSAGCSIEEWRKRVCNFSVPDGDHSAMRELAKTLGPGLFENSKPLEK